MLCRLVSAIATRISASISFEHMRDAGAAARRQRIGPGAAQQHEVRAEREHPHDVEARPDAAIGQHRASVRRPRRRSRGNARALDSTPSSWRPPWFETTMPSAPFAAASRASSGSRMPLMTSGPSHCERTHSTSFQLTLASKFGVNPAHKVGRARAPCRRSVLEIAERHRPPANARHPMPLGPAQHLAAPPDGRARPDSPGVIAIAGAGHCQVDGQNSAPHPAAFARSIMSLTKPRSLTI